MTTRRFVAPFAMVAGVLATVGGAGATAPPPNDPMAEAAFEFAECMRDNGVEDFADPLVEPDGRIQIDPPEGAGPDELAAAEEVCLPILEAAGTPAGGSGAPADSPGVDETQWEQVVPGGDCACADGSEWAFWVRDADPTKVLFFLEGGGACWDETMCAFTTEESTTYDWNVVGQRPSEGGIFDTTTAENPFRDYTYIFVPYCTGDVHLGDVTRKYTSELFVEHNGFVNGSAALGYLQEHYPGAEQVVVAGESAGSVAAPVYGGLVADQLPDAQVTVLADSSGAYPDDPDINTSIIASWGAFATMPDWEVNEGLTASDWGIPRFWIQAGLHDPDLVLARFDFAYDEVQTLFMEFVGADTSDVPAAIDANEAAIEAAGVVQHSYTAPGDEHTIIADGPFFEMEVDGVRLVDWVAALVAGDPLGDVHCDDCRAG